MGDASCHVPVKLIAGLITADPSRFLAAGTFLEKKFGRIESESRTFAFSCTSYYEKEFGRDLKRKFFSFKELVRLEKNYRIKLYTNSIERRLSGKNLRGANISAPTLTDGEHLKEVSNKTVRQGRQRQSCRSINIDPGYISLTKLVLFTTKNRSHRIYVGKGIYADLELQFARDSFRTLSWTYPDYRSADYIDFFNSVRSSYLKQVKDYL